MSDESSKTMMVDERQSVRQVLDSLLDKSHCGYSPDWSLVETITELQMGKEERGNQKGEQKKQKQQIFSSSLPERIFEDHENLVENLLNWTRDSHNKLMFIERIEKYALFKNPQVTAPFTLLLHTQTHSLCMLSGGAAQRANRAACLCRRVGSRSTP